MRTVGLLLSLSMCVALGACKAKDDANATPDPAALKAQQELVARRDALMSQRQKLQGERDQIDEKIKQVTATGGDTSELAKQRAAIDSLIENQSSDLSSISTKIDQVVAKGDSAANLAGREANMGSREKSVAARELQFAERERAIAQREATLAQREKETCGVAQPMIIQQVAAPKGTNYTRKEIEPLLGKARATMAKKGLVSSDLGPAAGLENESTDAMRDNDWGKAYLAAAQLSATVEAVKVDRNFIGAKAGRLQSYVKTKKRDEATEQVLADGMKEVMQKFGDGDFSAANRKLNQLWQQVK
ncbi:MAG: hypothetical protein H6Q90_5030 [Deltaproteobacteria bacterium]|nr:hypothetical protein [Deltaproteobacteria bacterium]